jgi:hypothetical protein
MVWVFSPVVPMAIVYFELIWERHVHLTATEQEIRDYLREAKINENYWGYEWSKMDW